MASPEPDVGQVWYNKEGKYYGVVEKIHTESHQLPYLERPRLVILIRLYTETPFSRWLFTRLPDEWTYVTLTELEKWVIGIP